jgi:thiamine-monophosphate kinase
MISGEQKRLNMIWNIFNPYHNDVINLSSGDSDDSALVKISDTQSMVIGSDFIRGSGFTLFRQGLLNYHDIGYYLVIANLSDIAAMGSIPFGITTIIRYKPDLSDNEYQAILSGIKEACDKHKIELLGGDIGSYESNVLSATAFGFIETSKALLRTNAKDHDIVCVTGYIGLPSTALVYFDKLKQNGVEFLTEDEEAILLTSWKRPTAKVEEGHILSHFKLANSCQDISDGLKATIEQISKLSNKHMQIFENKLPIHPITQKVAQYLNIEASHLAMSASVDFELFFTITPSKLERCENYFKEHKLKIFKIGTIEKISENIMINKNNKSVELPGLEWKQQTNDFISDILNQKTK